MKIAHASPATIKKVDNECKHASMPAVKSKRLESFEMFDRQSPMGSNVYQVITELDISVEDAEKFQVEYLKLKHRDKLALMLEDENLFGLIPV